MNPHFKREKLKEKELIVAVVDFKIGPVSDVDLGKQIKALIIADQGVGKTVLAASLAVARPKGLHIDIDKGSKSLVSPYAKKIGINSTNLDTVQVRTLDDVGKIWERVVEKKEYSTVIVDSISMLQENYTSDLLGASRETMEMRDWGKLRNAMFRLMTRVGNTPDINIVCTVHTKKKDQLVSGAEKWSPMLSGQFGDLVGAFFDYVFFIESRLEGVRRVYYQPTDKFYAKDRSGKLGKYDDDPTFASIVAKLTA